VRTSLGRVARDGLPVHAPNAGRRIKIIATLAPSGTLLAVAQPP
jgi:hypothetical protein